MHDVQTIDETFYHRVMPQGIERDISVLTQQADQAPIIVRNQRKEKLKSIVSIYATRIKAVGPSLTLNHSKMRVDSNRIELPERHKAFDTFMPATCMSQRSCAKTALRSPHPVIEHINSITESDRHTLRHATLNGCLSKQSQASEFTEYVYIQHNIRQRDQQPNKVRQSKSTGFPQKQMART